jgi:DNA topoisomerase-3
MEKLLSSGKTDLLTRFISRKGRPFKAYLVKTPEGKVGFEFVARPKKTAAATAPSTPPAVDAAPGKAERKSAKPEKRSKAAAKRRV